MSLIRCICETVLLFMKQWNNKPFPLLKRVFSIFILFYFCFVLKPRSFFSFFTRQVIFFFFFFVLKNQWKGITTILNSRTSVLAAANPVHGRYGMFSLFFFKKKNSWNNFQNFIDTLQSADDNINFQATILSRFDMIFLVKVGEKN